MAAVIGSHCQRTYQRPCVSATLAPNRFRSGREVSYALGDQVPIASELTSESAFERVREGCIGLHRGIRSAENPKSPTSRDAPLFSITKFPSNDLYIINLVHWITVNSRIDK